ncbi:hypothetical protein ACOME3_005679 [Neoechinorhynchus agilis]
MTNTPIISSDPKNSTPQSKKSVESVTSRALSIAGNTEGTLTYDQRNSLYPPDVHQYQLMGEIGRGATALVYAAKILKSNMMVGVKRINLEKFNVNLDELLKEIQVMCKSNHENVVRFYTSFVVGHELWLIMQLLDGGSLLDVIKYTMSVKNCINGVLDEVAIATVLKEVLKGLDYFHSNGHIHRDIKAGNILLATDGSVKIADFGVSAFIATSSGDLTQDAMRHTFVGTPCWMAPEVMDQTPNGYDTKADIWSFGILSLELATGTAPYHKYPPVKVLVMTLQNDPPTLETCEEIRDQYKHYSKTFRKMVDCCLQKLPSDRLTAKQLIKHDFFKKAKDKQYVSKHVSIPHNPRLTRNESCDSDRQSLSDETPSSPENCTKKTRHIKHLIGEEWVFDDAEDTTDLSNELASKSSDMAHQSMQDGGRQDKFGNPPTTNTMEPVNVSLKEESKSTEMKSRISEKVPIVRTTLTLRLRGKSNHLNDIKFDFDSTRDTCDLVTTEMVTAGLISGVDRIIVF